MAVVVENGSGLSTANAYVSRTEANTYFTDRPNAAWTAATDGAKDAAILKATAYIDATYLFKGVIRIATQALSWPRWGVTDREYRIVAADAVPQLVKDACCELAAYALAADLAPTIAGKDRVAMVKAGSAEVQFEAGSREAGTHHVYVTRLLSTLTLGNTGGMSMQSERVS